MLLATIEQHLPQLTHAEARVGRAVLAAPSRVVDGNIGALAKLAQSSEPTVVRFCRSVGCDGWHDFKLKLSQTLALKIPDVAALPTASDPTADLCEKICARSINVVMALRASLDTAAIDRALALLAAADRIEVYGQGTSGIVAKDCAHKLFRTGTPCVAYVDPYVHAISAALLTPSAAVIAISQRGANASLTQSARLAKKAGAKLIAIAPSGSALAKAADVLIAVDLPRDNDTYTPISARLAHLTVVDILAVGLAIRKGAGFRARVAEAQEQLRAMDVEFEGFIGRGRRG
jgi:RpiR family transcriptional regulator, carbohydrate utilization regulator